MQNTKKLKSLVFEYENPLKRVALSSRFPFLKPFILKIRILATKILNKTRYKIAKQKGPFLKYIAARHQSVLRRKLGDSNPKLQEQKITNLQKACESLNGLIIQPGEVFSMWETIGEPIPKRGYVNGMLLSNGKVVEGMGGGLCQLSNFLCWIFLHTEVEIIQRYHHSMDVFPDSGRTLPFGSGATCLYNFVDLKLKNIGNSPLQLKIWTTEKHLKGQILSPQKREYTFSLIEKNHCFIKRKNGFFRYNEIFRIRKKAGKRIEEKHLFSNFAPVLYSIPKGYFEKHGFKVLDFSE